MARRRINKRRAFEDNKDINNSWFQGYPQGFRCSQHSVKLKIFTTLTATSIAIYRNINTLSQLHRIALAEF